MTDYDSHEAARSIRPKRPGRWLRRTGLIGLTLVALTLIAHAWWSGQAGRRLAATVARYRAAGEPMTPEDLDKPPVPDARNAVVDLRAAAAAIDPTAEPWAAFSRR